MTMHRYLVLVLAFGTTLTAHPSLASPPTEARRYESLVCVEQDILPRVLIQNRTRQPVTLEQRMAELSVPGVSIAVIEEGAVAWARAYGLADIHGKIPVTTETLFQAASITKAISATAALDLVEDGLLDLDADVNDQLTLWKVSTVCGASRPPGFASKKSDPKASPVPTATTHRVCISSQDRLSSHSNHVQS